MAEPASAEDIVTLHDLFVNLFDGITNNAPNADRCWRVIQNIVIHGYKRLIPPQKEPVVVHARKSKFESGSYVKPPFDKKPEGSALPVPPKGAGGLSKGLASTPPEEIGIGDKLSRQKAREDDASVKFPQFTFANKVHAALKEYNSVVATKSKSKIVDLMKKLYSDYLDIIPADDKIHFQICSVMKDKKQLPTEPHDRWDESLRQELDRAVASSVPDKEFNIVYYKHVHPKTPSSDLPMDDIPAKVRCRINGDKATQWNNLLLHVPLVVKKILLDIEASTLERLVVQHKKDDEIEAVLEKYKRGETSFAHNEYRNMLHADDFYGVLRPKSHHHHRHDNHIIPASGSGGYLSDDFYGVLLPQSLDYRHDNEIASALVSNGGSGESDVIFSVLVIAFMFVIGFAICCICWLGCAVAGYFFVSMDQAKKKKVEKEDYDDLEMQSMSN